MVAQVGKLGAEYMKWVHSPVNRPLRLFGPEIIEFFSKTPWYMVPIVWLPVVLYISTIGLTHLAVDVTSFLTNAYSIFVVFVCIFLFGTFLWTLVEYILHRYLFHITPPDDSPFWITFHFFIHGQHHKVSFKTHFLKLYLYWIALSVLNCSSQRSSKDHFLLIQCYYRRKSKLN